MNILIAHNFYLERGGEDGSFRANQRLLTSMGHNIVEFSTHNEVIAEMNRLSLTAKTLWNTANAKKIRDLCRRESIDAAFFHNTFPLLSPAVYRAVRSTGAKVLQWIPNYRFICPNAQLYRDGRICEECVTKSVPVPGVVHRCYHDSVLASGVVAALITTHGKLLKTWATDIDCLLAVSDVVRQKLIQGGLPGDKIHVVYNHLGDDPGMGSGDGGYALFIGRLSPEKGVPAMLEAWRELRLPLKVVGDGPLRGAVEEAARQQPGLEYLGFKEPEHVIALMKSARLLIFPSGWFDPCPRVLIEACACGTAVVADEAGARNRIVIDGLNGATYRTGEVAALVAQVRRLWTDDEHRNRLRHAARARFLERFTARTAATALSGLLCGA